MYVNWKVIVETEVYNEVKYEIEYGPCLFIQSNELY